MAYVVRIMHCNVLWLVYLVDCWFCFPFILTQKEKLLFGWLLLFLQLLYISSKFEYLRTPNTRNFWPLYRIRRKCKQRICSFSSILAETNAPSVFNSMFGLLTCYNFFICYFTTSLIVSLLAIAFFCQIDFGVHCRFVWAYHESGDFVSCLRPSQSPNRFFSFTLFLSFDVMIFSPCNNLWISKI